MDTVHIGIDISKMLLDSERFAPEAAKPLRLQVKNSQAGFEELLKRARQDSPGAELRFCMESTGGYETECATFFASQGIYVSVVNPAFVKHFIRSKGWTNKTDQVDAKAIAEYSARYMPRRWRLAEPSRLELAHLRRYRERLNEELCRLHNYLEHAGQRSSFEHRQLLEQQQQCLNRIALTEQRILELVEQDPQYSSQLRALMTRIKGMGLAFALAILCELGDHSEYESAEQYAAMAGVSPCRRESGSMHGKTRISKTGCRWVRNAGWMPAMVAMRTNESVKDMAQRLTARGLSHKQVRVAAMRKLIMQAYGVLKAHARELKDQTPAATEKGKPIRFRTTKHRLNAAKATGIVTTEQTLGWRTRAAMKKKEALKTQKT
jgi:transposase